MIGTTDSIQKQRINVAKSCNDLFWAFIAAMLVLRFRRRVMYMACVIALLCVYIGWTISMVCEALLGNFQALQTHYRTGTNNDRYRRQGQKHRSSSRYSVFHICLCPCIQHRVQCALVYVSRRVISVFRAKSWYCDLPILRTWSRICKHLHQPNWAGQRWVCELKNLSLRASLTRL